MLPPSVFCDQALLSSEGTPCTSPPARRWLKKNSPSLQELFSRHPLHLVRSPHIAPMPRRSLLSGASRRKQGPTGGDLVGALTMSGPRALIAIGSCMTLAACAPRARLKEPSPDGPAISGLALVPGRTIEGGPVVLRFHFDSRGRDDLRRKCLDVDCRVALVAQRGDLDAPHGVRVSGPTGATRSLPASSSTWGPARRPTELSMTSHRAVHEDAPVRIGGWQ
jgi:hypothetical protein